ncbi:hypothetical protein V3C99_000600 [Haemonchus contortus]
MFHIALRLEIFFILSTSGIAAIVTSPCVDLSSRQEIRTVSADDRARLLAEYKHQRRVMGSRRFTLAIASSQLCDIVNRIDRALSPKRMPYWNARWDLRLSRPADSVIFSDDFFSNTRVRRDVKRKKMRESFPRGLTTHFRRLNINASLTSAIRANRAAQLLIILYHLGQWNADDDGCQACMTSSMAFCNLKKDECVSRLAVSANCSEFSTIDPCYASKCTDGICLPAPVTSLVDFRSTRTTIKKITARTLTAKTSHVISTSSSTSTATTTPTTTTIRTTTTTTTTTTPPPPTTTTTLLPSTTTTLDPYMDDMECIVIVDGGDDPLYDSDSDMMNTESWNSTQDIFVGTSSQLSGSISKAPEASTPADTSLKAFENASKLLDSPQDFYEISTHNVDHSGEITSSMTFSTEGDESSSVSTAATQIDAPTTPEPSTTASYRYDRPHFNPWFNTLVYPFNATLPFPTVYFSINVVTSSYRPRPRLQRSLKGVTVVSRGANLPKGYTHVIEALSLSDGHIIRVPDPIASGVGVEFFIIVLNNGRECDKKCLNRRRYTKCKRPTVRLSRYRSLTDPVVYYKTPRQAVEHLWRGAGYFRRRTQDPFVFTCFI